MKILARTLVGLAIVGLGAAAYWTLPLTVDVRIKIQQDALPGSSAVLMVDGEEVDITIAGDVQFILNGEMAGVRALDLTFDKLQTSEVTVPWDERLRSDLPFAVEQSMKALGLDWNPGLGPNDDGIPRGLRHRLLDLHGPSGPFRSKGACAVIYTYDRVDDAGLLDPVLLILTRAPWASVARVNVLRLMTEGRGVVLSGMGGASTEQRSFHKVTYDWTINFRESWSPFPRGKEPVWVPDGKGGGDFDYGPTASGWWISKFPPE